MNSPSPLADRMRRRITQGGLVVVLLIAPTLAGAPSARATTRAAEVETVRLTLIDTSRPTNDPQGTRSAPTRTLVTDVYIPPGKGPFPLVVMAHGNAGHPDKFHVLFGAWSKAGYVVAAPAFPLTNDQSGGPSVSLDFVNQPADMSFVIKELLARSHRRTSPLFQRIDRQHIGAAGFSLGGSTVFGLAFNSCCRDARVDAAIIMDAPLLPYSGRFTFRGTPVMFIHIVGDIAVPLRHSTEAFAEAAPPKFLMTLEHGLHPEPYEDAPSPHDDAVIAATTQFWNAYLRDARGAVRRIAEAGTVPNESQVTAVPR